MSLFKTLFVKQFIGELSVRQCLEVSSRQDVSVVSGNQIIIWSLPRYTSDNMFPMHLALVRSADVVLDLTAGLFSRNHAENHFSNNQAMSIYLDHTMSPIDEHHDTEHRAFKLAKWSPAILSSTECVLATLQIDHNLRLHRVSQKEWTAVLNVTESLAEFVRKENKSEINQLSNIENNWEYFTAVRSIVYRMAIVNFAWAASSHFDRRLHLAVAVKDGSLRFAVVQVSEDATDITFSPSTCRPFEAEPGATFATVVCLRCLALNEDTFIVLVGYSNGACYAVKVQRDCTYDFGEPVTLWGEEDDIGAKDMFTAFKGEKLVVAIIKGAWICLATLDLENMSLVNEVLPIKTEGKSECLSCQQTNIQASEECLLRLFIVYPNKKALLCEISEELTVEVRNLGLEVTSGYSVAGSGESTNGVLLYVVEKMACMSDKLMLTGANKLKILSTVPLESATATIMHIFNEGRVMLYHIKDYLDIVFYNFQKTQRLPDEIADVVRSVSTKNDLVKTMTPSQILLIRLMMLWSPSNENSAILNTLAREALRRRYLFILANNYDQDGLTESQLKSLSLFADYLVDCEPELAEKAYKALKITPSTAENQRSRDVCELCGDAVPLNLQNPSKATCSRGHQTGRCLYSLLLCRTTDLLSQCLTCDWFALNGDVWEKPVECILCGLPLTSYP